MPVIEMPRRPYRRGVENLPLIPHSAPEQALQPVRTTVPGRLGDRPAVVIFQLHRKPGHHLPARLPGLPTRKTPRHLLK
jgi:hypothetical protein